MTKQLRLEDTPLALPSKKERLQLLGSVDPIPGNKPVNKEHMSDLQNQSHDFWFALPQVGIDNLKYPIQVISVKEPEEMTSIGHFRLTTSLKRDSKGINMSRLTERIQNGYSRGMSDRISDLVRMTRELAEYMEQSQAELHVTYPWFYKREAPVTGSTGLNHSLASILVSWRDDKEPAITLGLEVQVTTLCPCSKEISEYSAHNQRGTLNMEVQGFPSETIPMYWKEELLNAAESNASSCLHPVLKRPDEKRVTEHAYENPRFVEDMVRLVAADLFEKHWVRKFKVECRNEESIHQHDALAKIVYDKCE